MKFAQRFVCPLARKAGEGLGEGNGHDRFASYGPYVQNRCENRSHHLAQQISHAR